jgi:hypothetical protein
MSPLRGGITGYGKLKALVRRIEGTLESDFERRHEAEDWAERRSLCSLHSAQFLAESDKLSGQSISVCVIGRGFVDGFAIEMMAVLMPGVIRSWGLMGLDLSIEGFGIDNFSLAGGFVIDGVG